MLLETKGAAPQREGDQVDLLRINQLQAQAQIQRQNKTITAEVAVFWILSVFLCYFDPFDGSRETGLSRNNVFFLLCQLVLVWSNVGRELEPINSQESLGRGFRASRVLTVSSLKAASSEFS